MKIPPQRVFPLFPDLIATTWMKCVRRYLHLYETRIQTHTSSIRAAITDIKGEPAHEVDIGRITSP